MLKHNLRDYVLGCAASGEQPPEANPVLFQLFVAARLRSVRRANRAPPAANKSRLPGSGVGTPLSLGSLPLA